MSYLIFDEENENHIHLGRLASPFTDENWIVAMGWKHKGGENEYWYAPTPEDMPEERLPIRDDTKMLVAFNAKFDLLHIWEDPNVVEFFKRGGKIWCCQLAEYLLEGQQQHAQMCSLDSIAEQYGGHIKNDEVKALWETGYLTSEIPKDLLIDYLVGAKDGDLDLGDIGNTEAVFLGQIKRAVRMGMLATIQHRMDALLATTEMEYRGLKIDLQEAESRRAILEEKQTDVQQRLNEYISGLEMPPEVEFSWSSRFHKSALLYGGTIKYRKRLPILDEETQQPVRKQETEKWPLFGGTPVPEELCVEVAGVWHSSRQVVEILAKAPGGPVEKGLFLRGGMTPETSEIFADKLHSAIEEGSEAVVVQDEFASGKRRGEYKTKNVKVPGEIKTKWFDLGFDLPQQVKPLPEWMGSQKDSGGHPVYSTSGEVMELLGKMQDGLSDVAASIVTMDALTKEIGTYYWKEDKDGKRTGMLTKVNITDAIIHHNLNHNRTATTRLSSDNPNLFWRFSNRVNSGDACLLGR